MIHYLRIIHLMPQKNKHDYYRCKDCVKNFYRDLRKHATKIISYEKNKSEKK